MTPQKYRFYSQTSGRIYRIDRWQDQALCNCPGYYPPTGCWHARKVLNMTTDEATGTEIKVYDPEDAAPAALAVIPPTALLPSMGDLQVIHQIARTAGGGRGLVPSSIKTPEQAFAIMLAGWEMGARPITALRHVFAVNGKTEPDAQLMMGVVQARDATAQFVFHHHDEKSADIELQREGRQPIRIQYSIDDAKASGQFNNGPWEKYPKDMLRWACIKRLCRFGAPELINAVSGVSLDEAAETYIGVGNTDHEEAEIDEGGNVVAKALPAPTDLMNEGDDQPAAATESLSEADMKALRLTAGRAFGEYCKQGGNGRTLLERVAPQALVNGNLALSKLDERGARAIIEAEVNGEDTEVEPPAEGEPAEPEPEGP